MNGVDLVLHEINMKRRSQRQQEITPNDVRCADFEKYLLQDCICGASDALGKPKFEHIWQPRTYTMQGFTDKPISEIMFTDSHADGDGGLISVKDWTEKHFGKKLQYPHWPGIKTVSHSKYARTNKQIIVPIEVSRCAADRTPASLVALSPAQ